jgi:YVTN family beta-propeller protein
MNIASGARWPKKSPVLSGAVKNFRSFLRGKRYLVAMCFGLFAQTAFAAPYLYVADYAGCTVSSTASYSYGCVSVIDTSTSQVVTMIPNAVAATSTTAATPGIGTYPIGMGITPSGSSIGPYVYVVNSYGDSTNAATSTSAYNTPGTVSVIDARQGSATLNTVVAQVTVGIKPEMIAINASGTTAYVPNYASNNISVIDLTNLPASGTAAPTIEFPSGNQPVGIALTPDGTKAYVTLSNNSQVAVIDLSTNTVTTKIPLSVSNPVGIVIDPAGKYAYVTDFDQGEYVTPSGEVSVIDLSTNTEVSTIAVGTGPEGIAMTPDGSKVYVTNYVDGTVSVIDTSLAVTSPTTAVTNTITVDLSPLGITIDSNGGYAYVSNSGDDSVTIIDLATNAVWPSSTTPPITVGTTPTYSVITDSSSLGVNLNQHGLTGSWYDPTVGGQGLVLDSVPDTNGTGNGTLFAGWFTWDTTASGGQRWYVLQGSVTSTNPVANLVIATSAAPGNFMAGPSVPTTQVGTATLQFSDCTHGFLTYAFTDGSNRQGSIPLLRLTGGATCAATGDSGDATGGDQNSGAWYTTDASGQGLILTVDPTSSGPMLSGGWFTYAQNGSQQATAAASQNWYVMQASQPGYTAPIISTTGGVFMNPGDAVTAATVGTMTADFTSCTTMTLTYGFTSGANQGLNNSNSPLTLTRLGPPPPGCE